MVTVCELEEKEDEDGPSEAGKGFFEASIAIVSISLNRHEGSELNIQFRFCKSRSEWAVKVNKLGGMIYSRK